MKILIVDDSVTVRDRLRDLLQENGHIVTEVTNGQDAIDYITNQKPDLIFLDLTMEGLSGAETASKIRALDKNESPSIEGWIPIIFLIDHSEEESLSVGIRSGGDDYLLKPFSKIVLNAKLKSMERIHDMRKAIIVQKELVEKINQDLLEEQNVAKHVYDNIVQHGLNKSYDFIKTYIASKSIFNGDIALVARSPSDNYYIMIGDFTGHGLSAALGIIPAAEVFLKLTMKGFTLEQLLMELNDKLNNILPKNIFCAAALLEVDLLRSQLAVWNGWSPDVLCFSKDGELKKRFASTNMPLGSLKKEQFNCKLSFVQLSEGDSIYVYSDGLNETRNLVGNMFGIDGIISSINKSLKAGIDPITNIIQDLTSFRNGIPQQDDLSLIQIIFTQDKLSN